MNNHEIIEDYSGFSNDTSPVATEGSPPPISIPIVTPDGGEGDPDTPFQHIDMPPTTTDGTTEPTQDRPHPQDLQSKKKPVSRRRLLWTWLHEYCLEPFSDSFQQQIFNEVVNTGISLLPVVWSHFPFTNSLIPCHTLSEEEVKHIISQRKIARRKRANRTWKDRILSTEGFFVIMALGTIWTIVMAGDGSSSTHPSPNSASNRRHGRRTYANVPHDTYASFMRNGRQ